MIMALSYNRKSNKRTQLLAKQGLPCVWVLCRWKGCSVNQRHTGDEWIPALWPVSVSLGQIPVETEEGGLCWWLSMTPGLLLPSTSPAPSYLGW